MRSVIPLRTAEVFPVPSTDETLRQATAALNDGDVETAERLCTIVLDQFQHPEALFILAFVREQQMRQAESVELLEKVQQICGETPNNFTIQAKMLLKLLENDPISAPNALSRAEALFCQAIELAPTDPRPRMEYADLLNRMGRTDEAIAHLRPFLNQDPIPANVLTAYARLAPKLNEIETAISKLQAALEGGQYAVDDQEYILAQLARLLDRQGSYDQAFAAMRQSNDIRNRNVKTPDFTAQVDAIINAFDAATMAQLHRARTESELPVYIVGLPRSGTSLVEEILASHPQVFGGGEIKNFARLRRGLPSLASGHHYPEAIRYMSPSTIDQLGQEQIDYLARLGNGAARVTAKQPTDFIFLGLISVLTPNARVINCRRNSLDCCLSMYFQSWEVVGGYIKTFESLAQFARGYERLMRHWHEVLDISILDVDYEQLIHQPETTVREMLEFLDLPWDENCLRFHQSERFVHTASHDQVRQPIYDRSIGRWRNYEKHLGPLRELLGV